MTRNLFIIGALCLIGLSFRYDTIENREGEPFFSDYRQVLHFKYNISQEEANHHFSSKKEKKKDYPNCLFENLPQKLDASLAENLFHLGFIRSEIKKDKFSQLDKIFSYQQTEYEVSTNCLPIYRDILIFRNKKTVKGIVQICFTCSQFVFIGSNTETKEFGQHSQPSQLKLLLYTN